jgi:type IV pilus assembly protein PilB
MKVPPIGCILQDMGILEEQDILDILEHQKRTGQKFGVIAVHWGLAKPEQVWQAWARQLSMETREADLDELGTDSTALFRVTPDLVLEYRIWPLRLWGDNLVIATAPDCPPAVVEEIGRRLKLNVHRCVVPGWQLDDYIRRFCEARCQEPNDELSASFRTTGS